MAKVPLFFYKNCILRLIFKHQSIKELKYNLNTIREYGING